MESCVAARWARAPGLGVAAAAAVELPAAGLRPGGELSTGAGGGMMGVPATAPGWPEARASSSADMVGGSRDRGGRVVDVLQRE